MTVGMSAPPIGRISSTPNASGEDQQHREEPRPLRMDRQQHARTRSPRQQDREVQTFWSLYDHRPRRQDFLQFAERHQAAGERQRAQQHFQAQERHHDVRGDVAVRSRTGNSAPCRPAPPPARRTRARARSAAAPRSSASRSPSARRSAPPTTNADDDPLVADDLVLKQRADDRRAMPICPAMFPRRAVVGALSHLSASTNSTAATT